MLLPYVSNGKAEVHDILEGILKAVMCFLNKALLLSFQCCKKQK